MYPMRCAISHACVFLFGFASCLFAQTPSAPSTPVASGAPATAIVTTQPEPPSTARAWDLFRTRKYDQAAAEYQRVIDAGISAPAGYAGLARVYLRQQKVDDAFQAARKAVELAPNLAVPHVALGEVYYRQGKIEQAAEEFRRLILLNTSDARAYYGMFRVMRISSNYHKAKLLLDRAHELDAKDPDISRAWANNLPLKDRITAIEAELGLDTGDAVDRSSREHLLAALKEVAARPPRPCTLSTKLTSTETPLLPLMVDAKRAYGYGLRVKFNEVNSTLRLDTGASGFNLTPRAAEKAHVERIADAYFSGIGDAGEQQGYLGFAESIQVGDLVFKECYVGVFERSLSSGDDGLMGANVFSQFLVELNFPDQKLLLSKLPEDPAQAGLPLGLETETVPVSRFHDRYVAPEMKSYFPVYRSGHQLMIPSKLNGQGPVLMLIDTGSPENVLNLDHARLVSKISNPGTFRMKGLSGEVKDVLRAQDVFMQIAGFNQKLVTVLAVNLDNLGRGIGIQPAGLLGFETLHMLDIKIDYRDGLVQFGFDPKRWPL